MQIQLNLTENQEYGVQYVLQYVVNPEIQKQNESLPEGETPKPLHTVASYMQYVLGVATDDYYRQLIEYKKKNALSMFEALSSEEQAALVEQLGIPDVV